MLDTSGPQHLETCWCSRVPWGFTIWIWALPLCKSELRAAFQGNEGIKFQIGLGKWSGWWGACIQHTGSKLLLSCHLTQQVPNFLLGSLRKPAKTWKSSDTWRHAWTSWVSQKSHSTPTPTCGPKGCSDNWDTALWNQLQMCLLAENLLSSSSEAGLSVHALFGRSDNF